MPRKSALATFGNMAGDTYPVPGKPYAGQRLFISGRRKVNARTRRGGERRGRAVIEIQSAGAGWSAGRASIAGDRSAHRAMAWSMPLVSDIDQPSARRWPVSGLRSQTGYDDCRLDALTSGRRITTEKTTATTLRLRPVTMCFSTVNCSILSTLCGVR